MGWGMLLQVGSLRSAFSGKVTFQKFEGNEGMSLADTWRKNVLGRGNVRIQEADVGMMACRAPNGPRGCTGATGGRVP